jgi:hydroxyacylglutathione hydrolase
MKLIPLPAFQDDSLLLLEDGQRALVVDPGDAGPMQAHLAGQGLQ